MNLRCFWKIILVLFTVLFSCFSLSAPKPQDQTCSYNETTKTFTLTPGIDSKGAAWGSFDDKISELGWGFLTIETNPAVSDLSQVLCAGYLEGSLTWVRIDQLFRNFWENTYPNVSDPPTKILEFTSETMKWSIDQSNLNQLKSGYWRHVYLLLNQFDGLVKGYNAAAPSEKHLTSEQLYLLNMLGDLDDLAPALERQEKISKGEKVQDINISEKDIRRVIENSHCSAIIKPAPGNTELFVAHDMWANFWQMLNLFKSFKLGLSTGFHEISFSSYPGLLSSEDDFYVIGSNLVVIETTNGIFNYSLYDLIRPSTLMSWIRAVVSNRIAKSGFEWVDTMKLYNSGTYNNQWMVVDFNKFVPSQPKLSPGVLVIGSQLPGYWESADVTDVINQQGYWPSYNIPYFKNVWEITGYPALVRQYGDQWTHEHYPRANIFRRDQGKAVDLETLMDLMRENDWKNDPLSLNCPINQISARADLAINSTGICSADVFGGINSKITSSTLAKNLEAFMVAGPTPHPSVFSWTKSIDDRFSDSVHYGQPTVFDFPWVHFQ